MSIETLPKDVLGLIFRKLWRRDAKGIPTTCKLFHTILTSKRWFKGWQQLKITIQDLPDIVFESLQQAAVIANFSNYQILPKPKNIQVKYDHLDTSLSVLQRLNSELKTNRHEALFGLDEQDMTFPFHPRSFLFTELQKLPKRHQTTIYCTECSFEHLEENRNMLLKLEQI